VHELGERYIEALDSGDAVAVLRLFADGATVVSPLYGPAAAAVWLPAFLDDTRRAGFELLDVLASIRDPRSLAVRLRSRWTLANGFSAELEGVHLLALEAGGRIERLTILYDTAAVRESFAAMKGLWGPGPALEQAERARVLAGLLQGPPVENPAASV
jgi:steroid delta-isomerase